MLQQMQLEGYSENTIRAYVHSLIQLSRHFNTSPDLLSIEQIRGYLQFMITEKKRAKSWLSQMVSAIKFLFCNVLKRKWEVMDIPRPRIEKKLPRVFSREEISKIIKVTTNLKHRAILMLIYSSGLRLGEAAKLKIADIDSHRMQVRIEQAKGAKDRYTILSPVALEMLRQYWLSYHPKIWLFETRPETAISERTIQAILSKALRKSHIQKKTGIHSLRHSFATHMMEQGVSLPIIQHLLGHKSLRTTSVYLHVQQYSILAVQSPLDSLSL